MKLIILISLSVLACPDKPTHGSHVLTNSGEAEKRATSVQRPSFSVSSDLKPRMLSEPIAVSPIVNSIREEIGDNRFIVQFKIAANGEVTDCKIATVEGKPEFVDKIPLTLRERLCAAIKRRQYAPPGQAIEASFLVMAPHLK